MTARAMSRLSRSVRLAVPALLLAGIAACTGYGYGPLASRGPDAFIRPTAIAHPADNPFTPAKADLGRRLFFDPVLSTDGTRSCASCHDPARGYADGRATAAGLRGRTLVRHTPTLWNVAVQTDLFWDGRAHELEDQALRPVASTVEMNLDPEVLARTLAADPSYRAAFAAAFPDVPGIDPASISRAIATFERTLVSPPAAFDAWLRGDASALSQDAQRGLVLFTGRANCAACHSGWALTDGGFHDVGLPGADLGRGALTLRGADQHAFRTPTLRELTVTGPYMHDGSLPTLAAVVDHYADHRTARRTATPPVALSAQDRADLVAFLRSLDSTAR